MRYKARNVLFCHLISEIGDRNRSVQRQWKNFKTCLVNVLSSYLG